MSDGDVVFEIDDVIIDGRKFKVVVKVAQAYDIKIDNAPSEAVSMEAADGEILEFELTAEGVFSIIEWCNFSGAGKSRSTKSYRISGRTVVSTELARTT